MANFSDIFAGAASSGDNIIRVELTASGNFLVPAGVTSLRVSGCGGGGGGGSGFVDGGSGGFGGDGAVFSVSTINVTPADIIAYTIGAGGDGGNGGGAGSSGLVSTFAAIQFLAGSAGLGGGAFKR